MNDPRLHEAAALYALGLLSPAEREDFERRLDRDPDIVALLRQYCDGPEALLAALPLQTPPPNLRDRVLAIPAAHSHPGQPAHHDAGLGAIRAAEGRWRNSKHSGITYKKLYFDKVTGAVTMLVRLQPGSVVPAHRHPQTEQCLIVEGDLIHDGHVYGPGDFTWAEAGSIDPFLTTSGGALLLIVGPLETDEVPV